MNSKIKIMYVWPNTDLLWSIHSHIDMCIKVARIYKTGMAKPTQCFSLPVQDPEWNLIVIMCSSTLTSLFSGEALLDMLKQFFSATPPSLPPPTCHKSHTFTFFIQYLTLDINHMYWGMVALVTHQSHPLPNRIKDATGKGRHFLGNIELRPDKPIQSCIMCVCL